MEVEKEIVKKMRHALNNNQNMTTEELKTIRDEVIAYAKTLGNSCGAFLWKIGLSRLI